MEDMDTLRREDGTRTPPIASGSSVRIRSLSTLTCPVRATMSARPRGQARGQARGQYLLKEHVAVVLSVLSLASRGLQRALQLLDLEPQRHQQHLGRLRLPRRRTSATGAAHRAAWVRGRGQTGSPPPTDSRSCCS